jgi:hypothetical protein
MGDRYDRDIARLRRLQGGMKPPDLILDWGLTPSQAKAAPAPVGHNGGPILQDQPIEEPADLYVRHLWTAAHRAVWKNPPMDILRFRLARAEAAGVTYERYMLELLDTGRHLQKADVDAQAAAPPGDPDRTDA